MKNTNLSKKRSNKLKKNDAHFLLKLAELLQSGFTQKDALTFLFNQYEVLKIADKKIGEEMVNRGDSLSDIFLFLGYRNSVISQVKFADIHGEIISNLIETSHYLTRRRDTIKKMVKTIQYPLILLSIFIVMLCILNYTVIPQFNSLYLSMNAEKGLLITILTSVLNVLPKVVLILILVTIFIAVSITFIFQQKDAKKILKQVSKIPILKTYFQYYISHNFGREFGYLIQSGVELKDILKILKTQEFNPYLKVIGEDIEAYVLEGNSFSDSVRYIKFLDQKIYAFIKHGEINSNVGKELLLYSEYTIENIVLRIERLTTRIQPVIFVILGFLIICLYLVIVLPVFQMMSQIN